VDIYTINISTNERTHYAQLLTNTKLLHVSA